MKKLIFILWVIAIQAASGQAPDPDFTDKMAFSEGRAKMKSAAFIESPENASYDLVYQKLDLAVDPAVRYISGSVTSQVKILKDNITEVYFDLSSALTIDSFQVNQARGYYNHINDKISVLLPSTIKKDSIVEVQIFYHGIPPETGFGSFTVSNHAGTPILWTLSEPYGARDWWPCKESLSDKIDSIDVYITCPNQYKGASNGKLISDQVSGNKRTAHWKSHYPIATYLVGIAVTNYETYSDFLDRNNGKKIEVLNYVYPEYLQDAKSRSGEILDIMGFYNSKLITYPFADEKYGHAQFGWGGGMEHQTMSFMTSLSFDLVSHEMAHQWFGDYITLASWHDIWLNEGFATFMTGLVYETLKEGYYWPIWKDQEVKKITFKNDGSVYVADTSSVDRIFDSRLTYAKGAYLLHMLRWEMGDASFFKGLKDYLTDPSLAYSYASQAKFVQHMEVAGDTSLTEYFKDWYYGEGYPNYTITEFKDINSSKQLIRVKQVPSNSSVSFFEMHIPIRVWKNGVSNDLRLYNTLQDQEFVISEEKVDSIQFDPQQWLCAKADIALGAPEVFEPVSIQIIHENSTKGLRIIMPQSPEGAVLRIVDMTGRTVLTALLKDRDSRLEISKLYNGMYVVEVKTKNSHKLQKIMISN